MTNIYTEIFAKYVDVVTPKFVECSAADAVCSDSVGLLLHTTQKGDEFYLLTESVPVRLITWSANHLCHSA